MAGGGTKTEIVDPYQGTGVRDLYGGIQRQVEPQLGRMFDMPSGPMFAGPGDIQQQMFGAAAGLYPQMQQQAQQGFGQAGQALGMAAAPFDTEATRQAWQQAFVDPAMAQWGDIQRRIMEPYAGRDAADSGAMNRALARAGGRLSTGLSGQLANMLYSGEQARLGRLPGVAQGYMGLAGAPSNLALGTMGGLMDIGGVQQQLAQQQISEPWQRQAIFQNQLGNYLGMGLSEPEMQVVQQQQGPGFAGIAAPIIGGALGGPLGGMLGASLFGGGGGTSPLVGAGGQSFTSTNPYGLQQNQLTMPAADWYSQNY